MTAKRELALDFVIPFFQVVCGFGCAAVDHGAGVIKHPEFSWIVSDDELIFP